MKYIVIRVEDNAKERELPFVFPDTITHYDMSRCTMDMLLRDRPKGLLRVVETVAAGFVTTTGCYGKSESLKINSRPVDSLLIQSLLRS